MVPHAERANTASFLEEVIKYVTALQTRNRELEAVVGSQFRQPPATADPLASVLPAAPGAQPYPTQYLQQAEAAGLRSSLPPPAQQVPQQQRPTVGQATDGSPGFRPVSGAHKHSTPPLAQVLSASPGKRSPTSSTATDETGVPPKKRHRSQAADQAAVPVSAVEAVAQC